MRIEVDDGIQCSRIDKPLLGKDGLQRLDPQRWFGRQQAVRIIVVVVMWHGAILVRIFN